MDILKTIKLILVDYAIKIVKLALMKLVLTVYLAIKVIIIIKDNA